MRPSRTDRVYCRGVTKMVLWKVFVWEIVFKSRTLLIFSLILAVRCCMHMRAYVCCVLELVAGDSVDWNELRLEFESCLCGPKRLRNE